MHKLLRYPTLLQDSLPFKQVDEGSTKMTGVSLRMPGIDPAVVLQTLVSGSILVQISIYSPLLVSSRNACPGPSRLLAKYSSGDFKELFGCSYYTTEHIISGNYAMSNPNTIQVREPRIDNVWCSVSPCDGSDSQCQECSGRPESRENHDAEHEENI